MDYLGTGDERQAVASNWFWRGLCEYLVVENCPASADVIFVLAGRPERKIYGLELYRQSFARRIILSVGRFEVRATGQLGFEDLKLRELAAATPPHQRHFFVEISSESRTVIPARIQQVGTYGELSALACYLERETVRSLILVSTSIHLRRVKWCCEKVGLSEMEIFYVPVPEDASSFRRSGWPNRPDHWRYLGSEYCKLVAYSLLYR